MNKKTLAENWKKSWNMINTYEKIAYGIALGVALTLFIGFQTGFVSEEAEATGIEQRTFVLILSILTLISLYLMMVGGKMRKKERKEMKK